MLPSSSSAPTTRCAASRRHPIYPRLAQRLGALLYPFMLDGVAMNPKLNQADGIHPNPAGVKIIVDRMLPYVKRLVAEARPAKR